MEFSSASGPHRPDLKDISKSWDEILSRELNPRQAPFHRLPGELPCGVKIFQSHEDGESPTGARMDTNLPNPALDNPGWYPHIQNPRVDQMDPLLSSERHGDPTYGISQGPHMVEAQTVQPSDLLNTSALGDCKPMPWQLASWNTGSGC